MSPHTPASDSIGKGFLTGEGSAQRNYVLFVLFLAFTCNIIDRQILAILMEPIKKELGLSDTHLGLLSGLSFGIFYSVMAIPIAVWADRGNRRDIIAITMTIFSAMTVVSGFVTNFIQLLLARIGVAIGEAGGSPPSHSMISDLFPPAIRTTAIAIYSSAINVGTLLGFLIGGWISQFYGWRLAFFVVGAPGLLIAVLMRLTVREPVRGASEGLSATPDQTNPSLVEVFVFLWSQRSFRHIACATILVMLGGTACFTWLPSFLSRSFAMPAGEIGTSLAIMIGVVGGVGTWVSGYMTDWIGRFDVRWKVWGIGIAYVVTAPFWILMYLASDKTECLLYFALPVFFVSTWVAVSFSMTQSLATVRMRTRASAVLFLIMSLIGGTLGPQITGVLSDVYRQFDEQESLRYALMTTSVSYLWAALHYILSARTLPKDIKRALAY